MSTFLHTADWQLGKPFAGVEDPDKRVLLQHERLNAVRRIATLASERAARFVVVSGDLFDSPRPTQATVASACSAIGEIRVPVFAIPGNHDHAGPGSLWTERFFLQESARLSPNLRVLLDERPVSFEGAVLLPCPLVRRQTASDPTAWLRSPAVFEALAADSPRIVIAHGSVQDFGSASLDDEDLPGTGQPNLINLDSLPAESIDYVALGDWHGTKQVGPAAWYPGTPELDRFVRGGDHNPGNVLVVTAVRGAAPEVEVVRTARIGWHDLEFEFVGNLGPVQLDERVAALIGTRADSDLLRLRLRGSLGLVDMHQLDTLLEGWRARVVRMKLVREVGLVPTEDEQNALTACASDPLMARVAGTLISKARGNDEQAEIARIALRELYVALHS